MREGFFFCFFFEPACQKDEPEPVRVGKTKPCCPSMKRQHSMTKRLSNKRKLNLFQYRYKFPYLNSIRNERREQERIMERTARRDQEHSAMLATARRATQLPSRVADSSTANVRSERDPHRSLAPRGLRSFFQSDDY